MVKFLLDMQLNNEKEMNSSKNQIESCISSTDSGVILLDNEIKDRNSITSITTIPTKTNIENQQNNFNNNKNKIISNIKIPTITETKTVETLTESDIENNETKPNSVIIIADDEKINNKNNYMKQNGLNKENQIYNIQNIISRTTHDDSNADLYGDKSSKTEENSLRNQQQIPSFALSCSNSNTSCNDLAKSDIGNKVTNSPTPSLRSTTISIVSIDENAIDSSVIDSNSECEPDAEGIHSNYVLKKLGQQTTYEPNSPELQNINKGLTVVGQTITPNIEQIAGNILNGGLCLPTTQGATGMSTPKAGNVTVIDSSDVLFGDQHYYDGPVTIQQFLIDSRNQYKTKQQEGEDNPTFTDQDGNNAEGQPNKMNSVSMNQRNLQRIFFNYRAIALVVTIIALAAITGVLFVTLKPTQNKSKIRGDGDDSRKNIPISSSIGQDNIGGGKVLRIVARDSWLAQPNSKPLVPLTTPIKRIVIIPTQTDNCDSQAACTFRVRFIQTYNIESLQHDDIIYNFLIGGDGNVYEGRGWDYKGAHLKGFNDDTLSFAYIGTFRQKRPTDSQLNVTKLLIDEGINFNKISPDYKLYSAKQLDPTAFGVSAEALYSSFKDWTHWAEKV